MIDPDVRRDAVDVVAPPALPAVAAPEPSDEPTRARDQLTALGGLAALSLDAMASVAYGPEAIVLVLAAAGSYGLGFTLPVTAAIALLLAVLTASYRQVIAAFPDGGGSYAVAKAHLGRRAALVAAASLVIDYILNVAVSVTAGVAALTSAFPALYGDRVLLCLGVLALITAVNLRGIAESARWFMAPTVVFVLSIMAIIVVGLFRSAPVSTAAAAGHASELAGNATGVGALLLLRAFASGCSALTGVEAVANAVPQFRKPRVRRAQRTETALGATLGIMLIGLAVLIGRFHLQPVAGVTVLAQLADASLGHGFGFYLVQFATVLLLALAANTSFGGLPVLMRLLARDNNLPHIFAVRADHQVHRHGVLFLGIVSAVLLIGSNGDVDSLVPLFAIGVFVGFTICQVGMVRHWYMCSDGFRRCGDGSLRTLRARAVLNGFGALLSGTATIVETTAKFTEGAWGIVLTLPLLVLLFEKVNRTYTHIGERLELGRIPDPIVPQRSLVVVPVMSISRMTREALSAAASLGDEVLAVSIIPTCPDAEDRQAIDMLNRDWELWRPGIPLLQVSDAHRRLGRPLVDFVNDLTVEHRYDRVTVLIAEVEPERFWQRSLQNQRGALIDRALRRGTDAVICRLRLRM